MEKLWQEKKKMKENATEVDKMVDEMERVSRERWPADKNCANEVRKWQVSNQQKELLPRQCRLLASSFPLNVTGAKNVRRAKGKPRH